MVQICRCLVHVNLSLVFCVAALGLNHLEVLDLSDNFGVNILSCVPESSSLKVLYLQINKLDATSYQGQFDTYFSKYCNRRRD